MRICAFLAGYPPAERVGAWISTAHYLEAAVKEGHRVDVLTPHLKGGYLHNGVHVASLANHTADYAQRADVILEIHGNASRPRRAAKAYDKPYITMVHGFQEDLPELLQRSTPDLVVFNSHSLAGSYGYDGRQIVCHPWLDVAAYETTPGDKLTLINLTHAKGVGMFDQLARYLPDREFLGVLGGYGRQYTPFRPNVTVMKKTLDIREVFSQTRILLMPSLNESWGMVAAEAACSGIPTIASDLPGIRECLGQAGTFVSPTDIDEWIDAIEGFDEGTYYGLMGISARERAEELANDDSIPRFLSALKEMEAAL